jgi:hypothetical protein
MTHLGLPAVLAWPHGEGYKQGGFGVLYKNGTLES